MLPEFELIGQKRFRTVHNVNKTKPLQFIMKKPKPLRKIIKKRNFDDEPKIEISSGSEIHGHGFRRCKLKSKEAKYSIIWPAWFSRSEPPFQERAMSIGYDC